MLLLPGLAVFVVVVVVVVVVVFVVAFVAVARLFLFQWANFVSSPALLAGTTAL